MKKALISVIVVGLMVGCQADVLTNAEASSPAVMDVASSACYAIRGTIDETGVPPDFAGSISGDLEGTTISTALGNSPTGVVIHTPGTFTYSITGGKVSGLIGTDLRLVASEIAVIATPADPLVSLVNATLTVRSPGTGHLTLHGSLDFRNFPPAVASLEYHGVVCPS